MIHLTVSDGQVQLVLQSKSFDKMDVSGRHSRGSSHQRNSDSVTYF